MQLLQALQLLTHSSPPLALVVLVLPQVVTVALEVDMVSSLLLLLALAVLIPSDLLRQVGLEEEVVQAVAVTVVRTTSAVQLVGALAVVQVVGDQPLKAQPWHML